MARTNPEERVRKEILITKPRELRTLAKEERRIYKKFEYELIASMPTKVQKRFKTLTFKEKLFVHYYFDSTTMTEAAKKAGYTDKDNAQQQAVRIRAKAKRVLEWIENRILSEVSKRTYEKNIISREIIIEKLARMFLPNISDFDNLDQAKARGLMDAVSELKFENVYNEKKEEIERRVKEIKLHDPVKVASLICKMLGYEAPQSKSIHKTVENVGGTGNQPSVEISINLIGNQQVNNNGKKKTNK